MAIAAALVALVLAVGAINDYIVKPRHVLATVEGTEIRRRDYWKVRGHELTEQIDQYSQIAQIVSPDQRQQYDQAVIAARSELETVWGTTDVNPDTLNRMIEDQLYLKNLDEFGLAITDQDVRDYIGQRFDPINAPIITPTPTATLIPARAAMATQTASAERIATAAANAAAAAAAGAPAPTSAALPVVPGTSGIATDGAATPAASSTPEAASPSAGTPAPSPTEEVTPNADQARQTAEAGYEQYRDNIFGLTHLSQGDYERLIVRPAVARQKVQSVLDAQIGQSAEQVHAAHILVDTKDLADSLYQRLQAGENFEQLAREQSSDEATAGNGGDLGWFTRGAMVEPFEQAAFSLQPNQISQPFETRFGWHIVKVYAHEQDRPLTDEQIDRLRDDTIADWLTQQRNEADISSEIEPTRTPATEEFQPPPGAPPPPTPTPTPTLPASPVASPTGGTPSPIEPPVVASPVP